MRGFINTVEALLGVMVVLVIMIYLFGPQPIQETDMHGTAYSCLKYARGSEEKMRDCLPAAYDFTIRECDSSDCTTTVPVNRTVTSAEYIEQDKLIKVWVYR